MTEGHHARPALDILRQFAAYGTTSDAAWALNQSVGLEQFLERWKREVLPFVRAGGSELRFVEAPNGRGKTHLLLALQAVAARKGFATCLVDCGLQEKPFASFADTYRAVAERLQSPTGNGERGAASLLEASNPEALIQYRERARGHHPGFVNLATAYVKRVETARPHDDTSADLRALLHNDKTRRVTFAELYQRLPALKGQIGRVGKRNAAAWLRSLLTLPQGLGHAGLVLLFDETGADSHLVRESPRKRQQHLAHLRQLTDRIATGGLPGCVIVYATTPDFIRAAKHDYIALHQRIARLAETESPPRNPRAVWCRLDELTEPEPTRPAFYEALGKRLVELGREAGLPAARLEEVERQVPIRAAQFSASLVRGAVRLFVKTIAPQLLCQT